MLRIPTLCALFALAPLACALELKPLALYQSGFAAGTEIVSVQASSLRVIVSNSAEGLVDILQLILPRGFNVSLGTAWWRKEPGKLPRLRFILRRICSRSACATAIA